jgi:hypothetical protein
VQDTYTTNRPGLLFWVICIAFVVVELAAIWKTFVKAGKPGWASIVPIYNGIVMLQIAGRPVWWFLLYFIPLVNIIIAIIVMIDFAKSFGKGVGFALGLIFLPIIFFPILAWGDAQYQGPPTAQSAM